MQNELKAAREATTSDELAQWTRYYDGYVRHAALARCAELGRSELLALAVGRLNDWVPAVRAQARMAVLAIMPTAHAADILATFEAIDVLRRARREDHSQWVARYEALAMQRVPSSAMVEAMLQWRTRASPVCFRLIRDHALLALPALIALLLEQKEKVGLAREGVDMIARLPAADREAYYLLALRSHFGPARAAAMRALLWQSDAPGRMDLALEGLASPQPSIRSAVHHFLAQQGVDLRSRYRAMIVDQRESQRNMNLLSLAACGNNDDVDFIKRYVDSPLPSTRIAALIGWFRLEPSAKDRIALQALRDESPRARRFGLILVRRHGAYVCVADLRSAFAASRDYRLMYIAQSAGIWSWLEAMAPLIAFDATIPDNERAKFAAELAQYVHSNTAYYQRPTAFQRTLLQTPAFLDSLRILLRDHTALFAKLERELPGQLAPEI